jgi:pre-rRNA-processing protein IPI1
MAKSAKAKNEKKKDFQKPKLKVGKTKPKGSNFTDISFKARSINVLQQSLDTNAPSTVVQFNHHLSLLGHKSEQQRLQSLSHLTSVLQVCRQEARSALPQPASVIVGKVQPLIRDGSAAVRAQVLKLLKCLPDKEVGVHAEGMLLWVRLGMTNLSAPIRMGALDVLEWLCDVARQEVISCAGGWSKTLKCFAGILGWDAPATVASKDGKSLWTSTPNSSTKGTIDSKLLLRTLTVLTVFLQNGLLPHSQEDENGEEVRAAVREFPLWQTRQHMLPIHMAASNLYGNLDLFGAIKDEEGTAYEGWEERAAYFDGKWRRSFEDGATKVLREGGGVGRAAVGLWKVMKNAKEIIEEIDL